MYNEVKERPVLKLKNDVLFKAVYGSDTEESKFILKGLLNKILDRADDPIVDIEYKNPFKIREYTDEKENILDIKAETDSNELIDIEMQILWGKDMPSRLLSYHGGLLREALRSGDGYDKMKKTITICITDSVAFEGSDKFLNEFYFMEKDTHLLFSDKTKIYCIELSKVNPEGRAAEELTPLERSLEYLKYADEIGSEYVDELIRRGGKELEMAQNILRKATEEDILREKAIAREKYLHDVAYWSSRYDSGFSDGREAGLRDGREVGLEEGRKAGLKEGREAGLRDGREVGLKEGREAGFKEGSAAGFKEGSAAAVKEMARKFKTSGISADIIAENTGLTKEEIETL